MNKLKVKLVLTTGKEMEFQCEEIAHGNSGVEVFDYGDGTYDIVPVHAISYVRVEVVEDAETNNHN